MAVRRDVATLVGKENVMTYRRFGYFIVIATIAAAPWLTTQAAVQGGDGIRQAEAALQAAINMETVDGDMKGAIEAYQAIVARYPGARAVAARALLRVGQVYQRFGDAQARESYQRIVNQYADQPEAVAAARAQLAALGPDGSNSQGDASMPARRVLGPDHDFNTASLSENGRFMAFTDWRTGKPAVRNMATGAVSVLAVSEPRASIYGPVVSGSGKQVAYAESGTPWVLRVAASDSPTTPSRQVMTADDIIFPRAWSPDGRAVLVEFRRGLDLTWQFAWVDWMTGSVRPLKSIEWRRQQTRGEWKTGLSPDGRYLAYAALAVNPQKPAATPDEMQDKRIYLLATDGSGEVPLTPEAGISENPVWTPDGSHVLFASDRSGTFDLWAVAVQNGRPHGKPFPLRAGMGRHSTIGMSAAAYYYMPLRGTSLAAREVARVAVVDLGESPDSVATSMRSGPEIFGLAPSWSPDGRRLAFARNDPAGSPSADLVIRTVATGEEARVRGAGLFGELKRQWFRDGTGLLQQVVRDQPDSRFPGAWSLERFDVRTGQSEVILPAADDLMSLMVGALSAEDQGVFAVDWVQDGSDSGTSRIVHIDLRNGGRSVVLTLDGRRIARVALSPDRKRLAVYSYDRAQPDRAHLGTADIDGSGYRDLHRFSNVPPIASRRARIEGLEWTGDGRALLFVQFSAANGTQLMRLPAEGGPVTFTGVQTTGRMMFAVDPTSSKVAVTTYVPVPEGGLWAIEGLTDLLRNTR